jgi:hypothetical protein
MLGRDEARVAPDKLPRLDDGTLARFAWPGMYPLFYIAHHGEMLCPDCARAEEFRGEPAPLDANINWENPALYCDECNKRIESAYAEPEEKYDA